MYINKLHSVCVLWIYCFKMMYEAFTIFVENVQLSHILFKTIILLTMFANLIKYDKSTGFKFTLKLLSFKKSA